MDKGIDSVDPGHHELVLHEELLNAEFPEDA